MGFILGILLAGWYLYDYRYTSTSNALLEGSRSSNMPNAHDTAVSIATKRDNNNKDENGWMFQSYSNEGEYRTNISTTAKDLFPYVPMCSTSSNESCHENPSQPSPRTNYSINSYDQLSLWWSLHTHLNQTIVDYEIKHTKYYHHYKVSNTSESNAISFLPRPLIFVGDSITESWNGTRLGKPVDRAKGVPQILQEYFVINKGTGNNGTPNGWDPLILAIAGDETQHLLYRLHHGELGTTAKTTGGTTTITTENSMLDEETSYSLSQDPTAVFVVLIGTNNLGVGFTPLDTVRGIVAVVSYILQQTKGHVVVLELLPRGDPPKERYFGTSSTMHDHGNCHGDESVAKQGTTTTTTTTNVTATNSTTCIPLSFEPAIKIVNQNLRQQILDIQQQQQENKESIPNRLGVINCNSPFFVSVSPNNKSTTKSDGKEHHNRRINNTLMPDFIHPNAQGHEFLATCILNYLVTIPNTTTR